MRAAMASNLAANALVRRQKVDPALEETVFERCASNETYNPKQAINGVEDSVQNSDSEESE